MRLLIKWVIVISLVTAAGWYILPMMSIRVPRAYRVEIDTAGGPIAFKLTFWPNDRGTRWKPHIAQSGVALSSPYIPPFDWFGVVRTVQYKPREGLIEIEFYDGESRIRLQGNEAEGMSGEWTVRRGDGLVTVPARAWRGRQAGFDVIATADEPRDFRSIQGLRDLSDGSVIDLDIIGRLGDSNIYAQARSGLYLDDLMHGRVDGDLLRLSYFDGRDAYLLKGIWDQSGATVFELWNGTWEYRQLTPIRR